MANWRKIVSLILTFTIVFVTIGFSFNISATTVTTMYIDGTDVGVRTGAGTEYERIEKISNRTATVLNPTPTRDKKNEYDWYNVTYHNGTKQITGWIAYDASYIRIVTYDPDASFEEKLKEFPESYHDGLRALKANYPNWEFIADPVNISFKEITFLQSCNTLKQVSYDYPNNASWLSMTPGNYEWSDSKWVISNGGWAGASREVVAFYMDPRNFLNADDIYMFLQQGYDKTRQNEEGVRNIVEGTFLANKYDDPKDTEYGGDYVKVIMAAAEASKVSPYVIASKIRHEIGASGNSSMISGKYSGYEGYYNFFNWKASGSNEAAVIANGLAFAKSQGWNTRSKSIIEGAKMLSNGYVTAGQDTYYLQDFNVHNFHPTSPHQYAQAAHDAYSKGRNLREIYKNNTSFSLTFKIPVFKDLPSDKTVLPEKNNKLNNYYLGSMSVSGLTPSFDKYTFEYSLKISGDTAIKAIPVMTTAKIVSPSSYNLTKGIHKITIIVESETGYTTDYNISVNADKDCVLYVNSTGTIPGSSTPNTPSTPSTPTVKRGDVNGDEKITISDIGNIKLHLLGRYTLSGNNLTAADVNKDGKITISDIGNIKLHLLGRYTIKD